MDSDGKVDPVIACEIEIEILNKIIAALLAACEEALEWLDEDSIYNGECEAFKRIKLAIALAKRVS